MKVVDTKGKLFGKLNIIDLLVILLVLAVLAFGAYKLLGEKIMNPVDAAHKIVYTTQTNAVEATVYDEVVRQMELAGGTDQLMADGKLVDAYITKIEAVDHVNIVANADGIMVRSQESGPDARKDITFTIEATVPNPTVNLVGTQEVRVGKNHILKTPHFEFTYSSIMTLDQLP